MPVLYVDCPDLRTSDHADGMVEVIRKFQWENWTSLRFAEPTSSTYRQATASMAERFMRANKIIEESESAGTMPTLASRTEEDRKALSSALEAFKIRKHGS